MIPPCFALRPCPRVAAACWGSAPADGETKKEVEMEKGTWCPKCNLSKLPGSYCNQCGTPLVGQPQCACGAKLYAVDTYCPDCGKKVSPAQAATPLPGPGGG